MEHQLKHNYYYGHHYINSLLNIGIIYFGGTLDSLSVSMRFFWAWVISLSTKYTRTK